ncbi:MAG: bacteriohemerythrin [Desulfotignum sp.]|nr:bacteriohemerythrin [Desulfotignum sp.]MCF8087319.1 bacteriohemerythrin [Desulfotignum sp.]MCF8136723.1 bacteriohemerythrin [Desulfotignum sp.]
MIQDDLKVEWESEFSVDVAEIDAHQKKMFDLFNELIDLKQKKAESKAIANIITDINDYSKLYFTEEERMLRQREYPDRDIHARYHRRFIRNALSLRREITEDVNNLSLEAIVSLRDWLIEHILTNDAMYVPFLRIHQYVEDASRKQ